MKRITAPHVNGTAFLGSVLAALLVTACGDADNGDTATVSTKAPEEMTREERIEMRSKLQPASTPETVPKPQATAVTGEVPGELMEKIMADLAQRTGADANEFAVTRAEAVQWPDGSLGCAEPGQMYTQAIVDGYRVMVEHAGKTYDYRASARGFFKLCPGFQPRQ